MYLRTKISKILASKTGSAEAKKLDRLPDGCVRGHSVVAITALQPHRECLHGEGIREAVDIRQQSSQQTGSVDDGSVVEDDDASSFRTGSGGGGSGSSGHALRGHTQRRNFTSSTLEAALRPAFEAHKRRWRLRDVKEAVEPIDPGAMGICAMVLRKLKGVHKLDPKSSTKLMQGLALCMQRRGFGVALHVASAAAVKEQALELARKKYYGEARKRNIGKATRFTRESVADALDSIQDTVIADTGEEIPAQYLVGYTVVPPSMMGNGFKNYSPVDALDCAASRGRCSGVFVVRGKKDADRRLHAGSVSHMLAAEGDLSIGEMRIHLVHFSVTLAFPVTHAVPVIHVASAIAVFNAITSFCPLGGHLAAEKALLGDEAFNTPDYLTIMDGGFSLIKKSMEYNPKANLMRCSRHLEADLVCGSSSAKASLPAFKKLVHVPKGHEQSADKIYDALPPDSPLLNIPKEQLCPVYLKKVIL